MPGPFGPARFSSPCRQPSSGWASIQAAQRRVLHQHVEEQAERLIAVGAGLPLEDLLDRELDTHVAAGALVIGVAFPLEVEVFDILR